MHALEMSDTELHEGDFVLIPARVVRIRGAADGEVPLNLEVQTNLAQRVSITLRVSSRHVYLDRRAEQTS